MAFEKFKAERNIFVDCTATDSVTGERHIARQGQSKHKTTSLTVFALSLN